jgi:hypothetical protein
MPTQPTKAGTQRNTHPLPGFLMRKICTGYPYAPSRHNGHHCDGDKLAFPSALAKIVGDSYNTPTLIAVQSRVAGAADRRNDVKRPPRRGKDFYKAFLNQAT